jgi:curved DNA-binding protein CbpA
MVTPQGFTDYYRVLKVDRTASQNAIKQAYRRLARQLHPDLNPHDDTAEARFKALNEAYVVLSDDVKRRHYDRYGQDWNHHSPRRAALVAGPLTTSSKLSLVAMTVFQPLFRT